MPLILKPHDLVPGMVLHEPLRGGRMSVLKAGSTLGEREISLLQQRLPRTLLYVVDERFDEMVGRQPSADGRADSALQTMAMQAAEWLMAWWAEGHINKEQLEKLNTLVERAFDLMQRTPITLASRKAGYFSNNYLTEHVARVFYYSLLLSEQARPWVMRERKRNTKASGLSDFVAGNMAPLGLGALLMDAGMTRIDGLHGAEHLSRSQKKQILAHPEVGLTMLPKDTPTLVKTIVAGHHENLDGTGYPGWINGNRVHLFSRIVRIADSFDAGTSPRKWRKDKSTVEVLWEMSQPQVCGGHYDAPLVEMFMELMPPMPVGTLLKMKDDRVAAVAQQTSDPFRPKIVFLLDETGRRLPSSETCVAHDLTLPRAPRMQSVHGASLDFLYRVGQSPAQNAA